MEKIWANVLIAGRKTWDEMPVIRQDGVKSILANRVKSGTITEDKYKEITGEEYSA